jgi:hypothetical protein
MVRLQGQMGQLTTAVEGLREEWEEAAGSIRGDREAIRWANTCSMPELECA